MKKDEVIEIALSVGAVIEFGRAKVFYTHKELQAFAAEIERRTLERAAVEAERMTWYPGGRQTAPAHDSVWHAARAIRALKEEA